MAWLTDALIKGVGILVLTLALRVFGEAGGAVLLIALFCMLWAYNVLFEVLGGGATPGKRVLGIRVVNDNGTPVTWGASILRNLVRAVDALPGTQAVGCVSMLLTERCQRLGDLSAGTLVVYVPGKRRKREPMAGEAIPTNVPLSLDEQQAIVTFAERLPSLSVDRQQELAELLSPMLGDGSVSRLKAHANWLVGRENTS